MKRFYQTHVKPRSKCAYNSIKRKKKSHKQRKVNWRRSIALLMSQCPDMGTSLSWFTVLYCQWLYYTTAQSDFLAQWIIAFTLRLVEGQSSSSCGWIVHLQAFTLHALWADMQISQIKGYDIFPANSSHYKKELCHGQLCYLILSNGKNSPPTYANAVFAVPTGRDTVLPRSTELEKSERSRRVVDVFPGRY